MITKLNRNIFEHSSHYLIEMLDYNETDSVKQYPNQFIDVTNAESVSEALTWIAEEFDEDVLAEIVKGIMYLSQFVSTEA
jgi:hypothetical protein